MERLDAIIYFECFNVILLPSTSAIDLCFKKNIHVYTLMVEAVL